MIEIFGTELFQWDTGRSVKVTEIEADHVHFANKGDSKAVIMDIADSLAKIPDYLLQTGKQLCVYAVKNGVTVESKIIYVKNRERPESYVYEDDQRNYIYALITNAEEAIEGANQAAGVAAQAAAVANTASANANLATENANASAGSAALAAKNANDAADNANHTAKSLMVIGSAKGNSIHLDGASDQFLLGMRIFGKTTQDGTPTPEAPVDLVSVGDEGSLSVSVAGKNLFGGDALADRLVKLGNATKDTAEGTVQFAGNQVSKKMLYSGFKKNTAYTIILKGWNTFGDGSNLWINYTDGSNAYLTFPASQTLSTIVYKTPANKTVKTISGVEYAGSTYLYYNECGIFEGDIATGDFEAYIGRSVSVDTPNGLPGIPVSSGGNYIDADGQQWICDEIDLARGVYVKRVGSRVLDGSSDEVWVQEAEQENTAVFRTPISDSVNVGNVAATDFLCTHLKVGNVYGVDKEGVQHTVTLFYFRILKSRLASVGVSSFRTLLANSPMNVRYVLATPIETPLSEEEIAAYAALRTYRGNTTVSNDAGAWMDIEYVMDAKKYIDDMIHPVARLASVSLPASKWTGSGNLYSQVVYIDGITENSQVNLTPTVSQMTIFYEKDITFITENDGGVVTIYVIGQKPTNDYVIPANIVEVRV